MPVIDSLTRVRSHSFGEKLDKVERERSGSLCLGYNNASHGIPSKVFTFTWLTKLSLTHGKLMALPDELIGLAHLTKLNFQHNLFTEIPKQILHLYRLETVDLSYNRIAQLPRWFDVVSKIAISLLMNPCNRD